MFREDQPRPYVITSTSTPDFDEWGWDDYWSAEDWIEWHKQLKRGIGKQKADKIWLSYWNMQTFGASPIDARSFNPVFRAYFKKENLLDAIFGGVSWIKPIGSATDVISGGSDIVSDIAVDTSKAVHNTMKILKYLIPGAILGGAIYLGYREYKKRNK